jgi:hypothetical protein
MSHQAALELSNIIILPECHLTLICPSSSLEFESPVLRQG